MTNHTPARPPRIHTFLSAKGGQGTTVTAAAFALLSASDHTSTLLVDAAPGHDCAAVLGLPEPHDPLDLIAVTDNLSLTRAYPDPADPDYDLVVIDAGTNPTHTYGHITLVTRSCYLALRRALALPHQPDDAVLVQEPGRSLHRDDVAAVLNLTIAATITVDPAIARTVDSGLLAARTPNALHSLAQLITTNASTP